MGKTLLLSAILFVSGLAQAKSYDRIKDTDLLDYLLSKAAAYSRIAEVPLQKLPPIYLLPKDELNKEVCPEDPHNCRNLAAVFDDLGYRILVRSDFDITDNFKPYDYSFLIHELIHALQYWESGPEIFKNCQAVFETELLAYRAQDAYLKDEGAFERLSGFMERSFYCEEEAVAKEYAKSTKVWNQRKENEWFDLYSLSYEDYNFIRRGLSLERQPLHKSHSIEVFL